MTVGNFTDVVGEYLAHSGYDTCQIARLAGLPRRTVANWLDGVVQKPRHWLDVVKLARALRLSRSEANEILAAAGHPPLAHLALQAPSEAERSLFTFWGAGEAPPCQTTSLPGYSRFDHLYRA